MFPRISNFRSNDDNEGRRLRFLRAISRSRNPRLDSSDAETSTPTPKSDARSITPAHSTGPAAQAGGKADRGPLGLNQVFAPGDGHKVDIVFVHGLGGSSRKTWAKHEDPNLFWPSAFLPLEPIICMARIFTFGYNADFGKMGKVSSTISDFAKSLLFDLKFAKDEQEQDLNFGNMPLSFVVHSMGGLVFKEAYMQGQNDPAYENIIKAVSAVVFLATPHRGTGLAQTLNWILQMSGVLSPKQYVSELSRNSFTLQSLNERFRHLAPRLDIFSFYENKATPIGPKINQIIVEKDSAVLGYPGEISRALNADHHNVCKFDSPKDPNYVAVKNAISSLVNNLALTSTSPSIQSPNRKEAHELRILLGVTEPPDVDYIFYRDQWMSGTNGWLLEEARYLKWLHAVEPATSVLWLKGGAATGKSVLSSFIINSLVEQGASCQYFFIRFGDHKKRLLSSLLLSIAYQIAQVVPEFRPQILHLLDETTSFENASPRTIWERVFKPTMLKMKDLKPIYWIIDGLDEADDARKVVKLLLDIPLSSVPLRILLVSRPLSGVEAILRKVSGASYLGSICIEGHPQDLDYYMREELFMPGAADYKENVIRRVVEKAQSNFLWVQLAVDELNLCHTENDVELAIQQLPSNMEALYDRMASAIAGNLSATNRTLATNILQFVTCSLRTLTVAELSHGMEEDVPQLLDFQRSLVALCGGFVVIDNSGSVAMVHQTAREYLLGNDSRPFHIDEDLAHRQLFSSCMRCLMTVGLRTQVKRNQKSDFLDYAISSWSSHLALIRVACKQTFTLLNDFLTGQWVLMWIQILATESRLGELVHAASDLSTFLTKHDRSFSGPLGDSWLSKEIAQGWTIDLIQLVGKFGTILRRDPESIYRLIPHFCPQGSSVYQLFARTKDKSLVVSGISAKQWDDALAHISFNPGTHASAIAAVGARVVVLFPSGSVHLFDASIFGECTGSPLEHGERVYMMQLNCTGGSLATYGYRTTKVWDLESGQCKVSIENTESRPRPLDMIFTANADTLIVAMDDKRVRSVSLDQLLPAWQVVAELEETELEGHMLNSSSHMALSSDGKLVSVAYRGHPISAWEVNGPVHINYCWRKRDQISTGDVLEAVWHPHDPELIGLYIEGVIFKWRPYNDEIEELATGASRLALSRDGSLFATGDVRGTVKVFIMSDFRLLFQMTSEDMVLGLTFSPDNHRFYDVRGTYGNAWEPSALMRFARQDDKYIASESTTIQRTQNQSTVLSPTKRIDSITTIAHSPSGQLYCCGTQKGVVSLYDTQRGQITDLHTSKGFLSIEQMSWNSDGRLFCFCESSRNVFIVTTNACDNGHDYCVETRQEIPKKDSSDGRILQLLFAPDSDRILIRFVAKIRVFSLTDFCEERSLDLATARSQCIIHPRNPSLIMEIGPENINVLDWTLSRLDTYQGYHQHTNNKPEPFLHTSVERLIVSHSGKYIMVQLSIGPALPRTQKLFYFETSSCTPTSVKGNLDEPEGTDRSEHSNQPEHPRPLPFHALPPSLCTQIAIPLALLHNDNLIFLSRDYQVCSRPQFTRTNPSSLPPLPTKKGNGATSDMTDPSIKPLFPLPSDWINLNNLALCSVWPKERSFLCPKNGEVAVVRCSSLV